MIRSRPANLTQRSARNVSYAPRLTLLTLVPLVLSGMLQAAGASAQVAPGNIKRIAAESVGSPNGIERASISRDGRYVAFKGAASPSHAYRVDRLTGSVVVADVTYDASDPTGDVGQITLSADGNWLAFVSWASNLVPGDTNGVPDVFLRNISQATTQRVSVGPTGEQSNGTTSSNVAVSDDGHYVAFSSNASNISSSTTGPIRYSNVFRKDMLTGATVLLSTGTSGPANADSDQPSISGDGQKVTFMSNATNLADQPESNGVYLWNNGNLVQVSQGQISGGAITIGTFPAISADGTTVVFDGAGEQISGLLTFDVSTRSLAFVGLDTTGNHIGGAFPTISANGRFVAYASQDSVTPEAPSGVTLEIYITDRLTGQSTIASANEAGQPANQSTGSVGSGNIGISGDGSTVAFDSPATNLVPGDDNNTIDVFVRRPDLLTQRPIRYVAFGDSVAYGHGLANPMFHSDAGTTGIQQGPSTQAYPSTVAQRLGLTLTVRGQPPNPAPTPGSPGPGCVLTGDQLAVSGAVSTNANADTMDTDCPDSLRGPLGFSSREHKTVEQDELPAANLAANPPALVSIQVGANDINFAACFSELFHLPNIDWHAPQSLTVPSEQCAVKGLDGKARLSSEVQADMNTLSEALERILSTVERAAPHASIVVVNYYQPIPPPDVKIVRDSSVICADMYAQRLIPSVRPTGSFPFFKITHDALYPEALAIQSGLNDTISSGGQPSPKEHAPCRHQQPVRRSRDVYPRGTIGTSTIYWGPQYRNCLAGYSSNSGGPRRNSG